MSVVAPAAAVPRLCLAAAAGADEADAGEEEVEDEEEELSPDAADDATEDDAPRGRRSRGTPPSSTKAARGVRVLVLQVRRQCL